jgi:serine phosphatase RsbU (regulator of sigma subunit)
VVTRNAGATVEKLQAAILAAVADFTRGALQGDDITILILRYLGTAKPGSDTSI